MSASSHCAVGQVDVVAFAVNAIIGIAVAFDYIVLGHETLAVEVSDTHSSQELLGFFRITGYAHSIIAFILCPFLCAVVSRSLAVNEEILHHIRFVRKEMRPPVTLREDEVERMRKPGEIHEEPIRGPKTVKAA